MALGIGALCCNLFCLLLLSLRLLLSLVDYKCNSSIWEESAHFHPAGDVLCILVEPGKVVP